MSGRWRCVFFFKIAWIGCLGSALWRGGRGLFLSPSFDLSGLNWIGLDGLLVGKLDWPCLFFFPFKFKTHYYSPPF